MTAPDFREACIADVQAMFTKAADRCRSVPGFAFTPETMAVFRSTLADAVAVLRQGRVVRTGESSIHQPDGSSAG